MEQQLTKEPVQFGRIGTEGHLYRAQYQDGNMAVYAGHRGMVGKLSTNLPDHSFRLLENQFFVALYGATTYILEEVEATGMFTRTGIMVEQGHGTFEIWELVPRA